MTGMRLAAAQGRRAQPQVELAGASPPRAERDLPPSDNKGRTNFSPSGSAAPRTFGFLPCSRSLCGTSEPLNGEAKERASPIGTPEEVVSTYLLDLVDLICPGCGEPVLNDAPDDTEEEWRHGDGSGLCFGVEPIELAEVVVSADATTGHRYPRREYGRSRRWGGDVRDTGPLGSTQHTRHGLLHGGPMTV